MDAVVLAGGYATRLWPLTRDRPKMLLPVGEETIIDGILSDLEDDDRISDVYVSTNEYFQEQLQSYVDESRYEKPELSIEETSDEDEKFGVLGALAQLFEREGIDDDVLVVAGDNMMGFDLAEFVSYYQEKSAPCIAAYDVGSLERATSYGVVNLLGQSVVSFEEKPDEPSSTMCSIACYAFPADTLDQFKEYLSGDNNPDEPGWFIEWLSDRGSVYAYSFDSYWFDVGDPEGYLEAIEWACDGDAFIADDATVENSDIGENVQIMDGASVIDSSLDNTVVFPNTVLRDAELRDSIVDSDSTVSDVALSGALLSSKSEIGQ